MQYLSPELSKKLTELTQENIAEIIQDKRYYVDSKDHGILVVCGHRIKWGEDNQELKVICPAWQVEDVLRNIKTLAAHIKIQEPVPVETFFNPKFLPQEYTMGCSHSMKEYVLPWEIMVSELTSILVMNPDIYTAYQKIEEYLWSILK